MTTDEFLAERRLRAAELALESARRRVAEADQEIDALRRQVAELEERVLAAAERAGGERAALRTELEAERRLRHLADQGLWSERERARGLEEELRHRIDAAATPAAERRLAEAERRARELRAELELVRHRAAEFEQQVRLAVDAAWAWLGETGDRVAAGLLALEALRRTVAVDPDASRSPGAGDPEASRSPAAMDPEASSISDAGGLSGLYGQKVPQSAPAEGGLGAEDIPAARGGVAGAAAESEVIPARFDEALSRLRSQVRPDLEPTDFDPPD